MKHPNKQHDGKLITIRAVASYLDNKMTITGVYEHIPKRSVFKFHTTPVTQPAVLCRNEWEVIGSGRALTEGIEPRWSDA